MIRTKLGLLGLCAVVLGVMAFSASAAQAEAGASWLILMANGEVLTGAQLPATIEGEIENSDASLLTEILKIPTKILCTAGTLTSAELIGTGSVKKGAKVKFTGCKTFLKGEATANELCLPHTKGTAGGTVETNAGHALIVLHTLEGGTKDELVEILPDEGETFATLEMNEACPIGEKVPIKGKFVVKDCEGKFLEHLVKHLIIEGPLTHLFAISDTAEHKSTIDGSAWIFLSGAHAGLKWGGMPG